MGEDLAVHEIRLRNFQKGDKIPIESMLRLNEDGGSSLLEAYWWRATDSDLRKNLCAILLMFNGGVAGYSEEELLKWSSRFKIEEANLRKGEIENVTNNLGNYAKSFLILTKEIYKDKYVIEHVERLSKN